MAESGKIEKIKGHNTYYKARFGAYRVGMELTGWIAKIFTKFSHN